MSDIRTLLLSFRRAHGLSQADLALKLGVSQQTLSKWEAGRREPGAALAEQLRTLLAKLRLNSREAWIERVSLARGAESLFDRSWTFLAASHARRNFHKENSGIEVIGRRAFEFFPARSDADIHQFPDHFIPINQAGFFQGSVRSVHLELELYYQHTAERRLYDLWPVRTVEGEILLHAQSYDRPLVASEQTRPSVNVLWTHIELVRRSGE